MSTSFGQRKAASRLQEARAAYTRAEFAIAELAAGAAVRLDPSVRAGWQLWVESLERQGKWIEAANALAEALEHHDHPNLLLSRVHALIETGQFAEAERMLETLRARWSTSREPLAYLARTLRDLREFGRLAALLDEALAGPWPDDAELLGLVRMCRAWQGREPAEPRPPRTSMRERLLTDAGVVLLGTGHDDGLMIPWYSTYLCSNYDVVATCARLRGFAAQFGWRWAKVAAIDPAARPLAILLAEALAAELVELPEPDLEFDGDDERYPDPAECLAVASLLGPGWSGRAHGDWATRCAEAGGLFAFGLLEFDEHTDPLPPIVGIAGGDRICLPWWRLGEARIGFGRRPLIAELPPEIDARSPVEIAADYRQPLAQFVRGTPTNSNQFDELGPGFTAQLRHLHEHRSLLHPGLRARSDFTRMPPREPSRPGPRLLAPGALAASSEANAAEASGWVILRTLRQLEAEPDKIGESVLAQLEHRFRTTPEVRSRLSDLLYRVAPDRFASLVHELVARPEAEVPIRERDGLLHLYGCNPWTGAGSDPTRATAQLVRWLAIGSATNRSEIVQSKYGLHLLAESREPGFAEILTTLLADEPAIAIGTLRWLHDNPAHHALVPTVVRVRADAHADVLFESLQCLRAAKQAVPLDQLERLIDAEPPLDPRLISAAIELLELLPSDDTHPILLAKLGDDEEPTIVWAAARSLLRTVDVSSRPAGAEAIAGQILEREASGLDIRHLLRALASADDYALFEPLLLATISPSSMKVIAAALTPAMLELDDPRLLEPLRRFSDAFGLDPAWGYADFLRRHGDPDVDRDAVYGAQGATDVRAGYQAKAVLARWDDANAHAELERALDYASPFREAALEVWFTLLWSKQWDRLDAALATDKPSEHDAVWTIVTRPRPPSRTAAWAEHLRADPARTHAWTRFIEARLRTEIPSKFVVGAQSASFGSIADLVPEWFAALCERALGPAAPTDAVPIPVPDADAIAMPDAIPDRLSVDLLEWLAIHRFAQALAVAERLRDSPHWGVRQAARRVYARRSV